MQTTTYMEKYIISADILDFLLYGKIERDIDAVYNSSNLCGRGKH